MADLRYAALHNSHESPICPGWEDKRKEPDMGFFTELFSRPQPRDTGRVRGRLAIIELLSETRRTDTHGRPADFPRLPRRFANT
jgi:hypothetical protein